jgi:hypothetical protein
LIDVVIYQIWKSKITFKLKALRYLNTRIDMKIEDNIQIKGTALPKY